ncbi:MAG: T9SS type A sorting domain-containing protein [Candidatus Cloacimonetes bacterium]|nr:T9SS type A sorting domain-containing protein [Candidatus Cloacimonadota bacterium]
MKKIIIFIIFGIFILSLNAEWQAIDQNKKSDLFNITSNSQNNIEIEFSLDGFDNGTIIKKSENYCKITYPEEGRFIQTGFPELPRFTRMITIPESAEIEINIEQNEFELFHNIKPFPAQPLVYESDPPRTDFIINDNFYKNGSTFPLELVNIGESAYLRDLRVVNITINPFQYDPKTETLKVFTNMNVSVNIVGGRSSEKRKKSRFFEPLYESVVINYDSSNNRDEDYQIPSYLFIYPDNTQLLNILRVLTNWKHQKGFEVHLASTSDTGTSSNQIKNYIQNAYDNWENPPEFLCIVGDAVGTLSIPTSDCDGGDGDQFYSLLAGDDILADIFLGRLSIDTTTDLQTIINKIIHYEKEPYLGSTDWYTNALLVGDPTHSGSSTIITSKYLKELISSSNPDFTFDEAYSGSYVNTMINSLNDGVSYFSYRGYIGMSGWDNSDTIALNNGFMLPVVMILTCATGDISSTYEDAESEIFLRVGTPSTPKGAIACVGTATAQTHTCYNNIVTGATFHGIFKDDITNMGGALTRGKLALYNNYPDNDDNAVNKFSYWNNLMGEPAIELWTGVPQNMFAEFSDQIPLGTNFIEITVTDVYTNVVQGAWITILKGNDEIFVSAYSDEDGKVILPIQTENTGDFSITITKHNYIPIIETTTIFQDDVFVNIIESAIDDDTSGESSGNFNGLVNPGETIELSLKLKNSGNNATGDITTTISCENEHISILSSEQYYGSIAPGEELYSNSDFVFTVNMQALNEEEVDFIITISDDTREIWQDHLFINIKAAELVYNHYNVEDGNNQLPDPGETMELIVTIDNIGYEDITSVYGTLSCENDLIEINDNSGYFGNIAYDTTENNNSDRFNIAINALTIPGNQILMNLELYNSNGFSNTTQFMLEIGEVSITDPYGPDDYGYYAYDDEDTDYLDVPIYNWIEIDPAYGGSGTVLSMSDVGNNGDIEDVDLPFVFPYYGQYYNMITICSNGFIVPGGTEQYSFMNREIPGPLGPSPMIAPFWDDLIISGGHVCYQYFNDNHTFVVEWSHLKNEYNGSSEETFQVILYDPMYYPTSTGDGRILFQYKTINNVDQGAYGSTYEEHGLYATIGLEDHTGFRGLQYTFNDTYPTAAKELENEMAIMFTGAPIPHEDAFLVLGSLDIQDENNNNQMDIGEDIELGIFLNNVGEGNAYNVNATISTSDQYIDITQNYATYGTVFGENSQVNSDPFLLSISENVPNGHIATINVNVQSDNDVWPLVLNVELYAPQLEYNTTFFDDEDNYSIDPDDSGNLFVSIHNSGGTPIENITGTLSTTDNDVSISQASDAILMFEGNSYDSFSYSVHFLSSIDIGQVVDFELSITNENGFDVTIPFSVRVGVSMEDFETGDFDSFSWEFSGSADWTISNGAFEGNYCAKSGTITHNQDSIMEVSFDVPAQSEISFMRKVSSENNYDYLYFEIDGQTIGDWSGTYPWALQTYTISAGTHTFEWRYHKDGSVDTGSDCAWIDNITFPGAGNYDDPELEFSISSFEIEMEMEATNVESFTITNTGGLVGYYSLDLQGTYDWITVYPIEGSVLFNETDEIYLEFSTIDSQSGDYECELLITNDGDETIIPITLTVTNTNSDIIELPEITELKGNYPNPFNPTTTIAFDLNINTQVKLDIYNIKGQKVITLLNNSFEAGNHKVVWNGKNENKKNVASGVYFYNFSANNYQKTKKMLMMK